MQYLVLTEVQKHCDIIDTRSCDSNVFSTVIVQIFEDNPVQSIIIAQCIPCLISNSPISITKQNTYIICTRICHHNIQLIIIIHKERKEVNLGYKGKTNRTNESSNIIIVIGIIHSCLFHRQDKLMYERDEYRKKNHYLDIYV